MRTAMRMKKYVHFIICLIFMAMTMLGIPPNVQAQSTLAPTTELSDTTPQQVWRIHIHKDGVLTRSIIDQTDSKSTSKDINSKTVDRSDYGQQNSYRIMEVTGGSISGKVLDENGQTVANAVVYAYTQDYDIYVSAYTDATGCYTISNLPSGTYTVTVDAEGWLEEDYPVDVSVTDSQDTGNINFNLKKGGTISGLVLDDNGQAVNNVRVYAYTQDYDIYKSAFTDATGCYTISNLPSGIYTVTVNAEGWLEEDYPGDVSVTDSQDTRNINFNLKKGGTISGQVLDDNGQAANNIRVNVHSKDYSIYESAYTDATGCYTISDLPSGIYIVTVDTDGWVKEDYPSNVNVTAPENTGNINFSLEKGGSISGQVLDENGQALQNIWISAHTLDYDFYDSISTTATGHYTIPNLPSKTYEVTVNADKWVSQDYPSYINVTVLQETGNVNFNLEKGGSISGQVLDGNGQPVNHAWVEAENSDYSIYESSDTDEEGHYVIPNLPGGLYKIRVDAEGWANKVYADNISVTALSHTASTNLVLEPGGSISGRVVDSQGVPVNNISMWANSENGESWNAAETNANGEYTISDLASGVYDVEVDEEDGNGFARIYKSDISVSVSNDTPNINFNLVPAGSISGRIVNSQGNPILDGWVWAESTASGSYNGAHTDANGDYCITNLASGSYEVTARAEGWQRQQYAGNVNVTASNETANINYTLQRGSATVAAVSDIPDFHINSGTPVNDLGLPSNIKITLSDDSRPHVGLSWDGGTPSYSPTVDGIYVFSGNLLIPSTNNPANQKAKLDVITGNAAPTFTSAIISGLAKEGNQLTASGIGYADAESDAAGTTLYQWIICETAAGEYVNIPEATSSSYTVKVSDIGKYIKVLVTPVASTGTLVGKGVLSSAIGPVCPVGFTNLSVAIDPTSKQVTISGNIDSGGDREVSVNVTDPDGNVDFTGKTKSDSSGAFNFIYTTTSTATGNFSVELNGDGVSTPAIIKFSSSGAFIDECFIATASFGSKFEPAVVLLRQFRDKYLLSNRPGQAFVNFYYKNSPPIAAYIAGNEVLKAIVRAILTPIVGIVYLVFHPMLAYALIILIVLRLIARRKRNINTRRVAY